MFASSSVGEVEIEEETREERKYKKVEKMVVKFFISEEVFIRTASSSSMIYDPVVIAEGRVINLYSLISREWEKFAAFNMEALHKDSFSRKDFLLFDAKSANQALEMLIAWLDEKNFGPLVKKVRGLIDIIKRDLDELQEIFINLGIDKPEATTEEDHEDVQMVLRRFEIAFGKVDESVSSDIPNEEILTFPQNNSDLIEKMKGDFSALKEAIEDPRHKNLPRRFRNEVAGASCALVEDFEVLLHEFERWKNFCREYAEKGAFYPDIKKKVFFISSCPHLFYSDDCYICGEKIEGGRLLCHGRCFIDDKDALDYDHCPYDRDEERWKQQLVNLNEGTVITFFFPDKKMKREQVKFQTTTHSAG